MPEFCSACGHAFESSGCPVSHDRTGASRDIGVGWVVTYRRALRRRTAVVVGRTQDGYTVIEDTGVVERSRLSLDDLPGSGALLAIVSPLYRLETLARTRQWQAALTPWLVENRGDLLATIGDRRMFALSALSAGDRALAQRGGLPHSEIDWLMMHAHRHAGDLRRALQTALSLGSDAYPDHPLVLVEAVSAHPELLEEAALLGHVSKLSDEFPGKAILEAAVGSRFGVDWAAAAAELDQLAGTNT